MRKVDDTSVIPESVRPDGSVRRARRVRPGYKPQEANELYVAPAARRGNEGQLRPKQHQQQQHQHQQQQDRVKTEETLKRAVDMSTCGVDEGIDALAAKAMGNLSLTSDDGVDEEAFFAAMKKKKKKKKKPVAEHDEDDDEK